MEVPAFSTVGTNNKKIDVQFTGGKLTSDAGGVLLHEIDRKLRLAERINEIIHDPRDPVFTVHQQRDLIAQQIFSVVKAERFPDEKTFVGKENTRYLVTNTEGSVRYDPYEIVEDRGRGEGECATDFVRIAEFVPACGS